MKTVPLALALLATAAPAAARPPAAPARTLDRAGRLLSDPTTQNVVALQITGLVGILLDTRVGPLAALADPADHARPTDTLRQIQRRRDPQFERHLYENARETVAKAGTIASGAAVSAAELHRTAQRLRAALDPLLEAAAALGDGR